MNLRVLIFLLAMLLGPEGYARNDFWLGERYSVRLSFDATDLGRINAPKPASLPTPEYPAEMFRCAVAGVVVLDYVVKEDGSVTDVTVVSSTLPDFAESAKKSVAGWRFIPANDLSTGAEVSARMRCWVEFTIDAGKPNKPLHGTSAKAPSSSTEPESRRP